MASTARCEVAFAERGRAPRACNWPLVRVLHVINGEHYVVPSAWEIARRDVFPSRGSRSASRALSPVNSC